MVCVSVSKCFHSLDVRPLHAEGIVWASSMRLTRAQHWQAARTLQSHGETDLSGSLCLMGMALLMLAEDLLELEMVECLSYAGR